MLKLEEYYNPQTSLAEDFESLGDSDLSHERHREEVNTLVINFVIKYLAEYLSIPEKDAAIIKAKAIAELNKTHLSPKSGNVSHADFIKKMLSVMTGEIENDSFGLERLMDLQGTAAIVKEIIFNDKFDGREPFMSLDFGSGSGILLAATLIAARRKTIFDIAGIGFEKEEESVIRSNRVLAKLPARAEVIRTDITNPQIYQQLQGLPIKYWVSETISLNTPPIQLGEKRMVVQNHADPIAGMFNQISYGLDPFPIVLGLSCENIFGFNRKVAEGEIAMFPDIFRGLYKPNNGESVIALRTRDGVHRILAEIGGEFREYENLDDRQTRWHNPENDPDFAKLQKGILKTLGLE